MAGDTKSMVDGSGLIVRILLVGKTGTGKSSLANAILGKELFQRRAYLSAPTDACGWGQASRSGLTIEVTDTPGVFDSFQHTEAVKKQIVQTIACMFPGPHAILFVLRGDARFTSADYFVFEDLKSLFKEDMTKFLILVLTRISQKQFTEEMKNKRIPAQLIRIMHEAGGRVVCVSDLRNKTSAREDEIEELLSCIVQLMRQNEIENYYFSEMMQMVMNQMSDEKKIEINEVKKKLVDEADPSLELFTTKRIAEEFTEISTCTLM